MKHQLAPAGAILVLCSHDERVAERGAQLFLEGWAPLLIFSGGRGAITGRLWNEPEAERFARIAVEMNVPREQILIEPNSTNTGENVRFTRQLLAERGIDPESFIVVQKPYMERRSYATFRKMWPEKQVIGNFTASLVRRLPRAIHAQFVITRRRGWHHGRRSATHKALPGARLSNRAGDPGRRLDCLRTLSTQATTNTMNPCLVLVRENPWRLVDETA